MQILDILGKNLSAKLVSIWYGEKKIFTIEINGNQSRNYKITKSHYTDTNLLLENWFWSLKLTFVVYNIKPQGPNWYIFFLNKSKFKDPFPHLNQC